MAETITVKGHEISRARSGTWICVPGPYTVLHFRWVGKQWFGRRAGALDWQWKAATLEACAETAIEHYRNERRQFRAKRGLPTEDAAWN